jgi:nucleoside-diphosphate-sugar epimerase
VDELTVDLTDIAKVEKILGDRRLSALIHLVPPPDPQSPRGTSAGMDAAIASVVRRCAPRVVVFSSTAAVYGDSRHEALAETSPTLGSSAYALAKLATERTLQVLAAADAGLSVTSLRIFNIAGPDFPESLVQRLLRASRAHPAALMCPDAFVRDYIHQSDVVRVILAAVAYAEPGYRTVNVGAGAPVSTRTLLTTLTVSGDSWFEVPGRTSVSWSDTRDLVRRFGVNPSAVPNRGWAHAHLPSGLG